MSSPAATLPAQVLCAVKEIRRLGMFPDDEGLSNLTGSIQHEINARNTMPISKRQAGKCADWKRMKEKKRNYQD